MICSWCGTEAESYAAHFQTYAGKPCRVAALVENPVQMLDGNLTHDQIRRRALRTLARTGRQDRGDQLLRDSTRQKDAHHEYRLHKRGLTQPPG